MILGAVIMSLFNIPEGIDIIEVRKKVNKMFSEARKKQNLKNVYCVEKNKAVFAILILFHKCVYVRLLIREKFYMHHRQWDLIQE